MPDVILEQIRKHQENCEMEKNSVEEMAEAAIISDP